MTAIEPMADAKVVSLDSEAVEVMSPTRTLLSTIKEKDDPDVTHQKTFDADALVVVQEAVVAHRSQ